MRASISGLAVEAKFSRRLLNSLTVVSALSSVLNASDQSRIGNRQGAFLRVLAWFLGFFTLISLGGGLWWLLSKQLPAEATGLVVLALTASLSSRLVAIAGRRLDADPATLLAKLAPVY